jgi:hypothetical protein
MTGAGLDRFATSRERAWRRHESRTTSARHRKSPEGALNHGWNKAVAYMGPGKVGIRSTDYPTFELKDGPGVNPANVGRKTPHGVIRKSVATNICGSDQHMVRGRTTAPEGLVLGHEVRGRSGGSATEAPATVLNPLMDTVRARHPRPVRHR